MRMPLSAEQGFPPVCPTTNMGHLSSLYTGTRHCEESGLFSYRVNLDVRVRADHPLRAVLELVDSAFARKEVAGFYRSNGNPSADPVILMKMMSLLFFADTANNHGVKRARRRRLINQRIQDCLIAASRCDCSGRPVVSVFGLW